jgi:threonine/homoserine/homoserine lactone efflux protein
MSEYDGLIVFALLVTGIIVVPGMDMLFVITNALTGGRRGGLVATLGIILGGAVHSLWGTLSVGILLTMPPAALQTMLFAGGAYMAWIGFTLLRSAITVSAVDGASFQTLRTAFWQGAVTCLLNPKAYIFVAAVYPQFMKPAYGSLMQQGLIFGCLTALVQLLIYGSLALAAARSKELLLQNPRQTVLVGRATGALFIVAAIYTIGHAAVGALRH